MYKLPVCKLASTHMCTLCVCVCVHKVSFSIPSYKVQVLLQIVPSETTKQSHLAHRVPYSQLRKNQDSSFQLPSPTEYFRNYFNKDQKNSKSQLHNK